MRSRDGRLAEKSRSRASSVTSTTVGFAFTILRILHAVDTPKNTLLANTQLVKCSPVSANNPRMPTVCPETCHNHEARISELQPGPRRPNSRNLSDRPWMTLHARSHASSKGARHEMIRNDQHHILRKFVPWFLIRRNSTIALVDSSRDGTHWYSKSW